jgi:hypothetical protein
MYGVWQRHVTLAQNFNIIINSSKHCYREVQLVKPGLIVMEKQMETIFEKKGLDLPGPVSPVHFLLFFIDNSATFEQHWQYGNEL